MDGWELLSDHQAVGSMLLRLGPCATPLSDTNSTLWYSGRTGSSESGVRRGTPAVTGHTASSTPAAPPNTRRVGRTNSWKVVHADTGLPGSPKARQAPPPALGTVAKHVGLPGFMNTRPKCCVPSCASDGATKSRSPMLTPPLDMTTSQAAHTRCKAASVSSILSGMR